MGLVAGEGTTIRDAANTLGVTVWIARKYLERLRVEGVVTVAGEKTGGARWRLAGGDDK